jgi:hypothetical protein
VRTRRYPTRYARGPFRLVRISQRGGYAIEDTRHTGPRARYALTEPQPNTGRPIPLRLPLSDALRRMDELAAEL